MDQKNIKELKRDLYRALLLKEPSGWTDTEVELAYQLAMDHDIQEILEEARRKDIDYVTSS